MTSSNFFPARNLRKPVQQDGAWLVAYKADQQSRFQGVLCSKKTADNIDKKVAMRKTEPLKPINQLSPQHIAVSFQLPERRKVEETDLDGFFLLKHCAVEDPSDLCSANIESCGLCDTKVDDLYLFDNVVFVKASDNMLSFEAMRYFPKLRELTMALNAIRSITVHETDFPNLEVLDLSFNNLSPQDIRTLGLLRNLRVLTASGNNLHTLPVLSYEEDAEELQGPSNSFAVQTESTEQFSSVRPLHPRENIELFPSLEVLNLDNNRFADDSVFIALAPLRRLHVLNLDKNEIRSVPYLQVVNGKGVLDESALKKRRRKSAKKPRAVTRTETSPNEASMQPIETAVESISQPAAGDAEQLEAAQTMAAVIQLTTTVEPAFCELNTLSLAGNPITRDADLLALVGWPMLQRILLHNTPLVNSTSGDPPIVRRIFKERLGMQVVRKEKDLQRQKPRVEIRRDKPERLYIKTEVIPIPKCDVDKLLAANALAAAQESQKPAITQVKSANNMERLLTPPDRGTPDAEPFFVTEVDQNATESGRKSQPPKPQSQPQPQPQPQPQSQSRSRPNLSTSTPSPAKSKAKKSPAKGKLQTLFDDGGWKTEEELQREQSPFVIDDLRFRGYEDLLKGVSPDPEIDQSLPRDMNGMVAALRYSLHHPLLLDTDTRLDRLVRPYHITEKPLPTTKQTANEMRQQRVEKAFQTMKNNQTVETISLVDVLKADSGKKQQQQQQQQQQQNLSVTARDRQNASSLYSRLNKQYDSVREQSLKHAFESLEKVAADIDGMRQSIQKNILKLTEDRAEDRKREIESLETKLTRFESPSAQPTSAVGLFMNKAPRSHAQFALRKDS